MYVVGVKTAFALSEQFAPLPADNAAGVLQVAFVDFTILGDDPTTIRLPAALPGEDELGAQGLAGLDGDPHALAIDEAAQVEKVIAFPGLVRVIRWVEVIGDHHVVVATINVGAAGLAAQDVVHVRVRLEHAVLGESAIVADAVFDALQVGVGMGDRLVEPPGDQAQKVPRLFSLRDGLRGPTVGKGPVRLVARPAQLIELIPVPRSKVLVLFGRAESISTCSAEQWATSLPSAP